MPLKLVRRGKVYHISGTVAGQRIRESTGLGERKLAEAWRLRRERELLERHALGRAATLTLAEAAVTYLEAGGSGRFLRAILDYAGPDTLLRDIDNAWLARAARALYHNAAPATVNRQLITPISAVYNMAAAESLTPPRRFTRRREPRGRLRWLTPEEAERLLQAAAELTLPRHAEPERYTLQKIAFLLGTGCRASECFAAEVQHWNPETWQFWVAGESVGAGKTEGTARHVRLPRRAVELIGELPEVGRAFRTAYGKPIKLSEGSGGQMAAAFTSARKAAELGPEVTPHVLRHTWATWFYSQTRDFGALMDLGGWDRADTANRYRKLAPDDLARRLLAHGWDFQERPSRRRPSESTSVGALRMVK
ncbi:tyrosine-type recombinase/integrase [Histidinibacterium aquaticum]|uniref:Tyrosine-type recombinase/integrase n=1 Tax=Histidinibacterium aquaticum TaxID=2613962 RepID=A0A5J5GJ75_9RHOB|nr:tyrosine-type recombinase/integrase [Histidinibacterium aquaticum]KAA9008100.1 tyrosine-type recombinase/integrase [Histidinibacterium aquaticum]